MSSDPKGPEPKTDAEKLEDLRYNRQSAHEEWLVAQAHIGGWRQAEAFLRQRAGEHFAVSEDIPAKWVRTAADALKEGVRPLMEAERDALRAAADAERIHIEMLNTMKNQEAGSE